MKKEKVYHKKPEGWLKVMFTAIKEARLKYKALMKEEVEKRKLLSSHTDWTMIEYFIQKINNDPKLRCKITLNDGTTLQLDTYNKERVSAYSLLEIE